MDRSAIAMQVVVLGVGVTLIALMILYLILDIFGRFVFQRIENKPGTKTAATAKPTVSVESSPPSSSPNEKLVAAIVGSISMFLLEEQTRHPFRISIAPSLKTGLTGKAWVLTGRKNLMTGALKLAALRRKENHAEV